MRFGDKRGAILTEKPNGQNSILATAFATKRRETGRKPITINESGGRRKHLFLFALVPVQPHFATTNKLAHNPKVAGSNPAPATNEIQRNPLEQRGFRFSVENRSEPRPTPQNAK